MVRTPLASISHALGRLGATGGSAEGVLMDAFDLERFVRVQESGGTYASALSELRAGSKRSHWMWFVFPQVAGLGRSHLAVSFALASRAEAQAYLAHPVLGARLRACAQALLDLPGQDPEAVFGSVDAMKLRSSMTLFEAADPAEPVFAEVLLRYFAGRRDPATLTRLA